MRLLKTVQLAFIRPPPISTPNPRLSAPSRAPLFNTSYDRQLKFGVTPRLLRTVRLIPPQPSPIFAPHHRRSASFLASFVKTFHDHQLYLHTLPRLLRAVWLALRQPPPSSHHTTDDWHRSLLGTQGIPRRSPTSRAYF